MVPEEKHKNAVLRWASPGSSFTSGGGKRDCCPDATSSSTLGIEELDDSPITATVGFLPVLMLCKVCSTVVKQRVWVKIILGLTSAN